MSSVFAWIYQKIVKPILFCFHPETMHTVFGKVGSFLGKFAISRKLTRILFYFEHPTLTQTLWGLKFTNPVGLAAWFDKDIQLCQIIWDIGFGFEEVGSITYEPYAWNPGTRLHRLKQSQWLLVNYGLKNFGVHKAIQVLKWFKNVQVPLLVSIAKTNCTRTCDLEQGIWDYQESLRLLSEADAWDGYVINISCPNAFGGEDFTAPERLDQLLITLNAVRDTNKPMLIKLPVDAPRERIQELLDVCLGHHIQGVIISNLTKNRTTIPEKDEIEDLPWGISWKPTYDKSNALIAKAYKYLGWRMIIVWVGGIFSAEDAYHKIKQGATLVQLITWMIFQWPQLIWQINRWLADLLHRDGFKNISEAVGKNVV